MGKDKAARKQLDAIMEKVIGKVTDMLFLHLSMLSALLNTLDSVGFFSFTAIAKATEVWDIQKAAAAACWE